MLRNFVKMLFYLKPCTVDTNEPSFCTQVTRGFGFPCAEHDICDPVSLLNTNRDNGSCKNSGAWSPLSIIDANVT